LILSGIIARLPLKLSEGKAYGLENRPPLVSGPASFTQIAPNHVTVAVRTEFGDLIVERLIHLGQG